MAFDIESGGCDTGLDNVKDDNDMVTCAAAGNLPAFITIQSSIDGYEIPDANLISLISSFKYNVFDSARVTFRVVVVEFFYLLHALTVGLSGTK
jgi:hypothetical protein